MQSILRKDKQRQKKTCKKSNVGQHVVQNFILHEFWDNEKEK